MECNWCERETDNEMVLEKNGYGVMVWNAYCDDCEKTRKESVGNKGQDMEFVVIDVEKVSPSGPSFHFPKDLLSIPCADLTNLFQPERLSETAKSVCHNFFEIEKAWGEPMDGWCPRCGRKVGCDSLNTANK